jgi:biotin carboxylase
MAKRAFIMVEAEPTDTGLLFVQAAKSLGLYPIKLSSAPARDNDPNPVETIHVDTNNLDLLIRECSRLGKTYDIAGVTSPNEVVYATVGKLCEHFDLPGPSPTSVERCCDKFAQRQLLAEAAIPVPAYRLAANTTEVERAAADIGLPVIVKPAVGRGSSGVRLCSDVDEVVEHANYLLGRPSPSRILVEEFARGRYYSVEIMGDEVIGIGTGEFGPPPHFVYREFNYPALLTDEEHQRIADVSLGCLRALGLGWGPKNVELRWTELGPIVIEVNPRLAGSPTPELVKLAYGIDLATEHVKLVVGDEQNLRQRYSQAVAVRFLVPDRDGILNWIDGAHQAAAVPGVAEVKFYAGPMTSIIRKGDYGDSVGHVIATSSNHAENMTTLNRAVDAIHWSITPFPTVGNLQEPGAISATA